MKITETKCELCGMIATGTHTDEHGVTHHYCDHHMPAHHASTQSHEGHDKHAGHSINMFRDRFWVSLLVTIPIMVLAPFWQQLLNYSIELPGVEWISAVLGSLVFFYGGAVFIKSAWGELKAKLPGMMTLIALAITAAYLYSLAVTFQLLEGMDFYWEVTSLITIMLLGHWIEMNAVSNAQNALGELAKLLPDMAERITNGKSEHVAVRDLKVGDVVLVRPGAQVPADGEVVKGASDVNEAMLTGESQPVAKKIGSAVIAGTVNGNGSLNVKVTKVGEQTALSGIMRLVAEAQKSRSRAQVLADRAAFYLTIIAIVVSVATLVYWLGVGAEPAIAIGYMVSVLVITCPHALGLAVPLVTSIATSISAKNGLLVRNRLALELARLVDVVLFDKTGTLTTGEQGVGDVLAFGDYNTASLLPLVAALEKDSQHPIGRALYELGKKTKLPAVTKWQSLPGIGVEGEIGGEMYAVGGPQLLATRKITIDSAIATKLSTADSLGKSVLYVLKKDIIIGAITIGDQIRTESKEAIAALHALGISVAMVTGDAQGVADHVAQNLGIDTVFAEVLPGNKVDKVKELQSQGKTVAMVGDGVNDAPALTQANVGIAIGAGTDVAIESAGIVLVKNDPRDVVKVFALSRATYRKMLQNLVWATGYNVVAIPLAAGVFAFVGLTLQPALAAVLMSFSTIIVAANAQLLRRVVITT